MVGVKRLPWQLMRSRLTDWNRRQRRSFSRCLHNTRQSVCVCAHLSCDICTSPAPPYTPQTNDRDGLMKDSAYQKDKNIDPFFVSLNSVTWRLQS
ncbi:hypothetical protein IRJ41_005404 [Triplophysa rosa]|uniref:Uncharacterized protein n=1 Tax=Triplophysa rosa TaxID=992332 RepID=A0A9W7TTG1_TRIRA|nr:hypothetical protein IRJ41_005404 [Triplophysa rosa]